MISLGVPDSHGRFSYWLPSFKVELPSPSREIGTLVFGDFELPSGLSRSDSLYIYIYFVFCVKGLCDRTSKIPESHIVAFFHVPRGHRQDPPFLRFLLFS